MENILNMDIIAAWADDRAKATTLVLAAGPSYDELLAAAQCWEHGACLWGKSTKMSMDAGIGHGLPSMQWPWMRACCHSLRSNYAVWHGRFIRH